MMVDTKAPAPPPPGRIRTILARHGEKLALAAAATALAGYLSLGVALKREDPAAQRLAALTRQSRHRRPTRSSRSPTRPASFPSMIGRGRSRRPSRSSASRSPQARPRACPPLPSSAPPPAKAP